MNQTKRLLPIGLQSFSTMIEEDYIYIDKTEYIYNLISTGRYYFLSRPRRFGKSLLISTLEQLFLGNRTLFKSLYIDSTKYTWQEHPVIVLNFASMDSSSPETLRADITWTLSNIGKRYGVDLGEAPSIPTKFKLLIEILGKKEKVAILVDEYDYPLLRNISDPSAAEGCRDVLRDFFSALKDTDVDKNIQFIFITGVSKFSKASVFSGLNNLRDISLDPRAAKLLGYTIEEIKTAYREYIKDISVTQQQDVDEILCQLKFWYNGYQFTDPKGFLSEGIYNPFSVMLYLSSGEFLNFWFDSGTPTFLMRLMKQEGYPLLNIEDMEANAEETKPDDVRKIKLKPILWQTGYLTIESYNPKTKNYKLRFPNEEVRAAARLLMSCENPNGNSPREKSELEARRAAQQVIGNAEASQQSPPREGKQVIGP